MTTIRKLGLIAALWAWVAEAFAAGGAYVVDDAEIVPAGECQVESWAAGAGNRDRAFVVSPSCTAAAMRTVELGFVPQRLRTAGIWTTEAGGQAKWLALSPDRFGFALAPTFGASYDTTNNQVSRYVFNLPASVYPADGWKLNLNLGWLRDQAQARDFLTWGTGAEWSPVTGITLIGEVFGRDAGRAGWQIGPRLNPFGSVIDLDLIAGRNVTGVEATWLTVGATFHFGF